MGKSYRLPYSTISGRRSSKVDKTFANRGVRRLQNVAVKRALDFDEFLLPVRYEANHNDVWDWSRDGKQRLQKLKHNDFNPFYVAQKDSPWTYEELVEHRNKSLEQHRKWIESLKRK